MSDDRTNDRQAIADLMTGWIHRDRRDWAALATLFHADATLRIMWFDGAARDFVEACRRMSHGPLRSKHFIGAPAIEFVADRAFVETNVILLADHTELALGATVHSRFLDRVSRRDGAWRIERRDSVYDIGGFAYPYGAAAAAIDTETLSSRHPREYAALAYLLESSGAAVTGTYPTRFSSQEQTILDGGRAWLAGAEERSRRFGR